MENQEITLHESDIKTLKGLAVHAAQALANKATATDEISSITVALEKELRRINQLNGVPEMEIQKIVRTLVVAGLSLSILHDRWQPCPNCGGKDRFRFNFTSNTFACNHCTPISQKFNQFASWFKL